MFCLMKIGLHNIMETCRCRAFGPRMCHHISRLVSDDPVVILLYDELFDLLGRPASDFLLFACGSFSRSEFICPFYGITCLESIFFFGFASIDTHFFRSYPCINRNQ